MARPKTRRQYGTGSIFQRSSDGRWLGQIQAGFNTNGRRRTITVSSRLPGDAGKADVKRKLDKKQREIASGGIPDAAASGRTTVKAFAAPWLERQATRLRPISYATTRSAINIWIVPTIGHRQLGNLTPADIRAVHKAILADLKPSTATRYHSTLTCLLRDAILEGHPVPQRVLLVEGPGTNATDRRALPVQEAAGMLAFAAGHLPHSSRWVAALLQGLRQGEALGLTWAAYDRLPDAIDISWQLQGLPYNVVRDRASGFRVPVGFEARQLQDRWHLVRPKTDAGRRIIPKIPAFADVMEAWRAIAPASPHDLVWPAADGSPADPAQDLAEWKAMQATLGIAHPEGRFYVVHETRHTTASLLAAAGVDRKTIEDILGQVKLVEAYLHSSAQQKAAASAKVAAALRLAGAGDIRELEA